MENINITQKDIDRFWSKVDKSKDCWEWNGYLKAKMGIWDGQYGLFSFKSKYIRAHRFSYCLHFGDFDQKLLVCHKCDNPKCVNPDHLFLGTYLDNNRDTVNKGRRVKTQNVKPKTHCIYGHELSGDNIKLHNNIKNGKKYVNCRLCSNISKIKSKNKMKQINESNRSNTKT